jgi:uncharacterized protein
MSIWRAAREGDQAEVERLVGEDPGLLNASDARGWTPLRLASAEGHVGVVRWLLDQVMMMTMMMMVMMMVMVMMMTMMMMVMMMVMVMVVTLLDQGAAIEWQCDAGLTALFSACDFGRTPVVRLLLETGADPTATRRGWTPLMTASSLGYLEVVRVLLGHPSATTILDQRNHEGKTGGGPATRATGGS